MKVLFLTFFIVLADQITKIMVKGISIPSLGINIEGMPYQSSKKIFGDLFKITFIENPGMAFGLQIGGKLFLSIFTIIATMLLVFFLYKNRKENLLLRVSLALILGGAIGNLIDRVFYGVIYSYAPLYYGRVVDFLHIDFPNFTLFGKTIYSWPIFNIADISVTVGFLMILIGYKKVFPHHEPEPEIIHNDDFEYKSYFEGESMEYSDRPLAEDQVEFHESSRKESEIPDERITINSDELSADAEVTSGIEIDIPVKDADSNSDTLPDNTVNSNTTVENPDTPASPEKTSGGMNT
ncbi:MAG: signal peptidase II [Bacteroidetes bacterium]|nr:signal peptidase II [Bacteroidota bacterium]